MGSNITISQFNNVVCQEQSQSVEYVMLLHVSILMTIMREAKPPVTWDMCRACFVCMGIQLLRNKTASYLDKEEEPILTFGHGKLPSAVKGLPKVKVKVKRCGEVLALLDHESSDEEGVKRVCGCPTIFR